MTARNSVDSNAAPRTRELVDIGGRALEVERAGIGQPTVVLEAGGGCTLDSWDPVWRALAALTHVVRYNRAGVGASHKPPTPRTVLDVVTDLHLVLIRAGIPKPYVLVGHSLGGQFVQLYAMRYASEVVGVVLVDSSHPDQLSRQRELLPAPAADESDALRAFREFVNQTRPLTSEGIDLLTVPKDLSSEGILRDLPLVVLTHGLVTQEPPDFPLALGMNLLRVWHDLQMELSRLSSAGRYTIAVRSKHFIHHDQPDLVVKAIHEVVEMVRTRRVWTLRER